MATNADIDRIFGEVCDLPAAERAEFLDRHVSDPEVRRKLDELLVVFDEGSTDVDDLPTLDGDDPTPARIGGYSVQRKLGSGGMGVVYLAKQATPNRLVAVKVLRGWGHAPELVRRFELEAELLGRLQHPGIAQIFESGTEGEGEDARAYLAMEYVNGSPLTDYVDDARLDQIERVRLLAAVADAIHHAHVRGVVHRDLKPSNILVTSDGQPKVIDFGVARVLDSESEMTKQTQTGAIVGTLAYMSPEQARGDVDGVDTRADVYALGVLAYRLLGGRLPHDLSGKSITVAAQIVCDVDPPRLGRIAPECRGDLEWIVARALEKEPARRYQSAGGLAADLQRHLDHEPIEARPASAIYQLRKIARRHRAVVGGAVATLLAILIGSGIALRYAIRNAELARLEADARDRADENAARAQAQAELARENEQKAIANATLADEQADIARRAADEAELLRSQAVERLRELQRIADYQSSIVAEIDPESMGEAMSRDYLDGFERTLQRNGLDAATIAAEREAFARALAQVNPTEVAVRTIDRVIFDRSIDAIEEQFEEGTSLKFALLTNLAETLTDFGLYERAPAMLEHVIAGYEEDGAPPHLPARARASLGRVLHAQRRFEEARPVMEQSLRDAIELHGRDSGEARQALVHLGAVLLALQESEQAEVLFRRALEAGVEDHVTGAVLGQLSSHLADTGRNGEALEMRVRACQINSRLFGEDDIRTLEAYAFLGDSLLRLDRFQDARDVLHNTHASFQRALGDDHAMTIGCLQRLAMAYCGDGRLDEGAPLLREVVDAWRRTVGDRHPSLVGALNNLAYLHMQRGEFETALPLAEELYEIAHALWGPVHHELLGPTAMLHDICAELYDRAPDEGLAQRMAKLMDELKMLESRLGITP